MSNHSSDSIVPQHEHGLSGATEFSGSLTQTNLQNIDFIGSRDSSTANGVEVDKHWKGVQDFNRQLLFELDPELHDPGSHSDSSAEYASHIERADDARDRLDATSLCSLKLYKSMPKGSSPFSAWASAGPADWPDKSYRPSLPVDKLPSAKQYLDEPASKETTSADGTNNLDAQFKSHDPANAIAIEVDDCVTDGSTAVPKVRRSNDKALGDCRVKRSITKRKRTKQQGDK